jgi:transposase
VLLLALRVGQYSDYWSIFRSIVVISGSRKVVLALCRREEVDAVADGIPEIVLGSGSNLFEKALELRESHFDGVEVGAVPRRIGWTKGGLNSKLHAGCDGHGRPLILLLSEGQMIDYKGAALMVDAFPKAKSLLADKGYDADWFRDALAARGIAACIPSKSNRKVPIPRDPALYRPSHTPSIKGLSLCGFSY